MRINDLFEDHSFLTGMQTSSYLDLILKCLIGSSRAITKYLDTPPEQHLNLKRTVMNALKAKNQDAYGDMNDIVDTLKADGHIRSINDVRTINSFFQVVDTVIRSKREQES